jgi:hypothetical protein
MGRQIEAIRKEYLEDPSVLDRNTSNSVHPSNEDVVGTLPRISPGYRTRGRRGHFRWSANDAEGFVHAVTGLAHADVVVLDGKWVPRSRPGSGNGVLMWGAEGFPRLVQQRQELTWSDASYVTLMFALNSR